MAKFPTVEDSLSRRVGTAGIFNPKSPFLAWSGGALIYFQNRNVSRNVAVGKRVVLKFSLLPVVIL